MDLSKYAGSISTRVKLVKVELTRKIKELLQDPNARKELQSALAEGDSKEIRVGEKRYELVPLSAADTRAGAPR